MSLNHDESHVYEDGKSTNPHAREDEDEEDIVSDEEPVKKPRKA